MTHGDQEPSEGREVLFHVSQVAGWWFWTALPKHQPSPCCCQSGPGRRAAPVNSHVYKLSPSASLFSCEFACVSQHAHGASQVLAVHSGGSSWDSSSSHTGTCPQPHMEGFPVLSSLQTLNSTLKATRVTTKLSSLG